MARIPTQTKIAIEDVPAQQRDWMGKIIGPLNQFISSTIAALDHDLSFSENLRAQLKSVTFVNNNESFPIAFQCTVKTKPIGVLKLRIVDVSEAPVALTDAVDVVDWEYTQDKKIQLNILSGLVAGQKYTITLVVI